MTDEQNTQETLDTGSGEEPVSGGLAPADEPESTLIVARFDSKAAAAEVYNDLREAEEDDASLHIDGVVVVTADQRGTLRVQKMVDHSTRSGLRWGIVGGVVAAAFLPATIVGGAVALGVAGSGLGKWRNLIRRKEVVDELAPVVPPNTSAVVCLVSAPAGKELVERVAGSADELRSVTVDSDTTDLVRAAYEAAATAPETSAADAAAPGAPTSSGAGSE